MNIVNTEKDYGKKTLDVISFAKNLNKWIIELIQNHFGEDILEIGSGIGNISKLLPIRNRLTLTDLVPDYLDLLQNEFSHNPSISVYKLDIGHESACQGIKEKYDTIICLNVLEHVKEDCQAVKNMSSLLKKHGTLVLLVPQYQWLYGSFDKGLGHYRRYNNAGLKALLEAQNLRIIKTLNFNSLAIIGWWLNTRLLKKKHMNLNQIIFFDKLVPVLKIFERLFPHPGQSIINISQKM